MVTSSIKVTCPCCNSQDYEIEHLNLVDTDLCVSYTCKECGRRYTDTYALVYLGGNTETFEYDRDNLISNH